jgi:hypothetical protein
MPMCSTFFLPSLHKLRQGHALRVSKIKNEDGAEITDKGLQEGMRRNTSER